MDINKLKLYFLKSYKSGNKMELLQKIYLCIAIASIFLAGLIALLNQAVGIGLLIVPLVAFVAYSVNLVAWSIVTSVAQTMINTENDIKQTLEASFAPNETTKSSKVNTTKKSSTTSTKKSTRNSSLE